jgi:Fuc2NAc and GlcNAc transferase
MPPLEITLTAAAVAFAVAWGLAAFVRRWSPRVGLLDLPNERSSHQHPRPRGGGLALLGGVLAGLLAALVWIADPPREAVALFAAALALAVVGLVDDRRPLPVWPRLLAQLAAAIALVAVTGGLHVLPLPPPADLPLPAPLGAALAVLWLVAATNFFNFMDGIDGLASGQAAIVLVAVAVVGWSGEGSLLALLAAAAALGFLVLNWPPASLFLGDGGSGFLGFLLAGLPLLAPAGGRGAALFVVAVAMALFLLDPTWTLLVRLRRGERLGVAHREHLYQRLTVPGRSHAGVTVPLLAAGAVLTALAGLAYTGRLSPWWALAAALAAFAAELAAARAVSPSSTNATQNGAPSQVPSAKVAKKRSTPPGQV